MLITWEDKLHDKMMSAYSKSCGYKKFSVHTNTKKYRFQIVPLWRAFSKSSVFVDLFLRISVDGSRIRNNEVAFFKFIRHSVDGALDTAWSLEYERIVPERNYWLNKQTHPREMCQYLQS